MDPDTLATVIGRGDEDDLEDAIELVEELTLREQVELFGTAYETLLSCMERPDVDSRVATVRVVAALSPATGRLVAETTVPNHATPTDSTFETAIDRQAALYVAALGDEAAAVREAAVEGIEDFSVACRMAEDRGSLEALYDDLEAIEDDVRPGQREEVEQAKEHVFSKLH